MAVNVKLAQAIGPMFAQIALVCDAVHQSEAGPLSQDERGECYVRALELVYQQGKSPQVATDMIANEMGRPPWVLYGILGGAAILGGAWLWSRKR